MLQSLFLGLKRRKAIPSKGTSSNFVRYSLKFPKPFSILKASPVASNSSHSLQLLSRVLSLLFCIFHFPIKKSKSFRDEFFDEMISRSPDGLNNWCSISSPIDGVRNEPTSNLPLSGYL